MHMVIGFGAAGIALAVAFFVGWGAGHGYAKKKFDRQLVKMEARIARGERRAEITADATDTLVSVKRSLLFWRREA